MTSNFDYRQRDGYFLGQDYSIAFKFVHSFENESVPSFAEIYTTSSKKYPEISDSDYSIDEEDEDEEVVSFVDALSEDSMISMEETVFEWIEEYVKINIIGFSNPKFTSLIINDVSERFIFAYSHLPEFCEDNDSDYMDALALVSDCVDIFMTTDMSLSLFPPRSNSDTYSGKVVDYATMSESLTLLERLYQPEQRTLEWYQYRHGMITASNIYKVFGSDALANSLIFEKCKMFDASKGASSSSGNPESSLGMGIRYEPVSALLYEYIYNTKLSDFGCMKHGLYDCIGASPDGINTDINSPRYGRMLEIKNIVNREITGIPLEAYWVQMQFQMEVCGLEECDFFETRFKEYNTEFEFYNDECHAYKGVILHFIKKYNESGDGITTEPETIYEYLPMRTVDDLRGLKETTFSDIVSPSLNNIKKSIIKKWINSMSEKHPDYVVHNGIYWKLDEMSCVLVSRNKLWLESAIPKVVSLWETITRERVEGFEHRSPKKRVRVDSMISGNSIMSIEESISKFSKFGKGFCVIKLEDLE
jgi:hypothetical protein